MSAEDFHTRPFDEGTLTKLEIFKLYTRAWLPVFLANESNHPRHLHLFDFFAGPGTDSNGVNGSPLRTLEVLSEYSQQNLAGWNKAGITAHFFDASPRKIKRLREIISQEKYHVSGVTLDVQCLKFADAFVKHHDDLSSQDAAKLLLIDQCGVATITDAVFRELVAFPRTDFLFFISSATLRRFHDLPVIKQKITLPSDHYHVHRAVLEYYRALLPKDRRYYLAPFSIRKGPNIYGLIFGSAHPLGMDKFLDVAWRSDQLNGEADFDIHRDNLPPDETFLDLGTLFRPSKVTAFERVLEQALRTKQLCSELDVIELCFAHGITRQHAKPMLKQLKEEGIIDTDFLVPDIRRLKQPRPIRYC